MCALAFFCLFVVNFLSACSGLVNVELRNDEPFVFEGANSLRMRPDNRTWILRWNAVPIEGASYEIFLREFPPSASGVSSGLDDHKTYNFDSPTSVTNDDYYISESLLLKNNTCFVVRLKYPGYTDNNINELCTGQTAVVASVGITKPPAFVSLKFINAAFDKVLNAAEQSQQSEILLLQATDFITTRFAVVSGNSSTDTCSTLPAENYKSDIPLSGDSSFAIGGEYKVCVELANATGDKVYGITTDTLTVD